MSAAEVDLPPDQGRSWWLREALAADPGEPCPPLTGDHEADVVIVGGGYTGLWTAWNLLERDPGLDIVLLEQDICGGGPSGRNGGFTNGWWTNLGELVELFGDERAIALCEAGDDSTIEIGSWCEANGVDAWYGRSGDLGVATSPAQEGRGDQAVEIARHYGKADKVVALTQAQVRERIDAPALGAGLLNAVAATVQPARLARGLRRVLLDKGLRIYEDSPVRRFSAGPPSFVETPGGRVRADTAVLAVNAWAGHWRRFHHRVTVRGSYIVLTEPAPEHLETLGWTGGEGLWNFRAAVNYVRTTADGRIAFGAGGMQPDVARRIGPRFSYDEGFVARTAQQFRRMFPSLADVQLEAAWGGPIDVTGSHLPTFGTLAGTRTHYGFGYTGNGVAPSHLGGKILASLALGEDDRWAQLPLVGHLPRRFPPEPIRSVGMFVANQAILRKDDAEDLGRGSNPLVRFVARLPRRLGYHLGP
ncbi:MAG: FAD-binding oxidoreductase [Actinomycetota bacterium]